MKKKKISKSKIIDMQKKKTGMLFQFCCLAPVILSEKTKYYKKFEKLGLDIGLLFQIADDIIDYKGNSKNAGKKTQKDKKKGKATLISLLGYQNTINYTYKLKNKVSNLLKSFGDRADDVNETINYVLLRSK